jgi:hypothetical protein
MGRRLPWVLLSRGLPLPPSRIPIPPPRLQRLVNTLQAGHHCRIGPGDVNEEPSLLLHLLVVQHVYPRQLFDDVPNVAFRLVPLLLGHRHINTLPIRLHNRSCPSSSRLFGKSSLAWRILYSQKALTVLAARRVASSHSFAKFPVTCTSST